MMQDDAERPELTIGNVRNADTHSLRARKLKKRGAEPRLEAGSKGAGTETSIQNRCSHYAWGGPGRSRRRVGGRFLRGIPLPKPSFSRNLPVHSLPLVATSRVNRLLRLRIRQQPTIDPRASSCRPDTAILALAGAGGRLHGKRAAAACIPCRGS